uniref:Uncharacterized protein LOC111110518 isoform X2 n=1 Tax=Crassostrea virginica TaxID=6565 RepID=A0A8B8BII7_CRAVI|nr:uncharacterized protein LOC111110518 isoform X2 [Crassostrea virginica]
MFTILYVILLLIVSFVSSAFNVTSEICLQRLLEINDELIYNNCDFNGNIARKFFSPDPHTCQSKCIVSLYNVRNNIRYSLEKIILTVGGSDYSIHYCFNGRTFFINCSSWKYDEYAIWNEQYCGERDANCLKLDQTCICQCLPGYIMVDGHCLTANVKLDSPCLSDRQCTGNVSSAVCSNGLCRCQHGYLSKGGTCHQENVAVGGTCVSNKQCTGTANSGVCKNGKCVCETEYILFDQFCYEGNVPLDDPCNISFQCSRSPYTICLTGRCACIEGYKPNNSSTCILRLPANENEAFIGNQNQKESSMGSTLGALFGGVLLGVLITTVIGFIIYKRSQQNYKTRQTEEPTVVFADNHAYGNARIQGNTDNASRNNKNNQRKIVNVPPYAPSDESPEYGNVSQTSRTKRTNDDIYNHLNEQEKPDNDDNYDHACAATGHTRGDFDSNYSSMRDVDNGYGASVGKGTDDYFTLEQN